MLEQTDKGDAATVREQLVKAQENQEAIRQQLSVLQERVEKTLHKADKFPSKKDIQTFTEKMIEVVKVPNQVEQHTLKLIESQQQQLDRQADILAKQAAADDLRIRSVIKSVRVIRDLLVGGDSEQNDELYPLI